MARVVIKLGQDISSLMPVMGRLIESCGVSAQPPGAAFRFNGHGVVVDSREITVYETEDPAAAVEVIDLLKGIESSEEQLEKSD